MRVGVIGGGPAGLYAAKFLAQNNHFVTVFEKEPVVGGMYRYAQLPGNKLDGFTKIITSKNVNLIANYEINENNFKDIEGMFDAFILATGGTPILLNFNNKKVMSAINVIKNLMESENKCRIGPNVLIVGMGNVSLDLAKLLLGGFGSNSVKEAVKQVKTIDVISRSDISNSKFTNAVLRDIVDLGSVGICVKNSKEWPLRLWSSVLNVVSRLYNKIRKALAIKSKIPTLEVLERIKQRRYQMLTDIPNKDTTKKLTLIFNTQIESIVDKDSSLVVKFKNGVKKTYDTIISSIGFASNPIKLTTSKPVFSLGWCKKPSGNIADALIQAKLLSTEFESFIKRKKRVE